MPCRTGLRVLLFLVCMAGSAAHADIKDEIFEIFDTIHQGEHPRVLPEPVRASATLDLFYAARDYEPAWQSYDYIKRVLAELAASEREGLLDIQGMAEDSEGS